MHLDKDMAVFLQGLAKASSLSQLSVSLRVSICQKLYVKSPGTLRKAYLRDNAVQSREGSTGEIHHITCMHIYVCDDSHKMAHEMVKH